MATARASFAITPRSRASSQLRRALAALPTALSIAATVLVCVGAPWILAAEPAQVSQCWAPPRPEWC